MLVVWSRHIRGIETALARTDPTGIPALHLTGERELDRIIGALNEAGRRLAGARREAEALALRVTTAERLAAIGRVGAGVASDYYRARLARFRSLSHLTVEVFHKS